MNRTKFLSAEDAALLVKSGNTVAVSGNGAGMTSAEAILAAIEARFLATGEPRDLTLVHSLGLGDRDRARALVEMGLAAVKRVLDELGRGS